METFEVELVENLRIFEEFSWFVSDLSCSVAAQVNGVQKFVRLGDVMTLYIPSLLELFEVSVLEDFAGGFGFGSVAGPALRFASIAGTALPSVESNSKKRRTCFYIGGSTTHT